MFPFLFGLVMYVVPPVLMYHRVDVDRPANAVSRDLTVTPQQLVAQLRYLRSRGIAAVSFAGYERQLRLRKPLAREVILTFDDGYADQYRYAFPALERDRAAATFYIVTGNVGRGAHMTWADLKVMLDRGMDIAAHGVTHDDLSLMSSEQQTSQIKGSITTLEARLRLATISSYAYPSGRFNLATLRVLRTTRVPVGVTTDPQYVIAPANLLQVTRLRVHRTWSLGDFEAAVGRALVHPQVLPR